MVEEVVTTKSGHNLASRLADLEVEQVESTGPRVKIKQYGQIKALAEKEIARVENEARSQVSPAWKALHGHGGIVDQCRQRLAGAGADLLTLSYPNLMPDQRAGARARLEAHLNEIDHILTESLSTYPVQITYADAADIGVAIPDVDFPTDVDPNALYKGE